MDADDGRDARSDERAAPDADFGRMVRAARERAGLSQRGLAERLGASPATVARVSRRVRIRGTRRSRPSSRPSPRWTRAGSCSDRTCSLRRPRARSGVTVPVSAK